jgi:hypothetical protein
MGEIELTSKSSQGDLIMVEGDMTSFIQKESSLELDNKRVEHCENCDIGVRVEHKIRINDTV